MRWLWLPTLILLGGIAFWLSRPQRLLALDPADVAALTFELSALCDATAAEASKGIAPLTDYTNN